MAIRRRKALLGGGALTPYVDLWFSAGSFRVATTQVGTLLGLAGWSFTRASLATMFDATGKLTYGPNNLLVRSQEFDNASWVKTSATVSADATTAPDGTLTADKLVEAAATSTHTVAQGISVLVGQGLIATVYAKNAGRNWVVVQVQSSVFAYVNLTTGAVGTTSGSPTVTVTAAANGFWRISVASVATGVTASQTYYVASADGTVSYLGDGTSGIYLWGAKLEAVTYQTTPSTYYPTTTAAYYGARLVYDPVTQASLGILVEEARTNACLYCRDLTNAAWVKTTMTAAKDQTGIDGVANSASLITATSASAMILQTIVLASSTRQQSAYVKRVTGTGTINMTTDGTTWTAITVTGAWTRVTIPAQASVVNPVLGFQIMTSGDAIAVDFVQNEAGTGASSPIPTTTASVTRAADVALGTGLALTVPRTLVVEWTPNFDNASSFRRAASITNSGLTSSDSIYQRHTTNSVRANISADMDTTLGTGNASSANKAAARFETNNSTGALNGSAAAAPDTSSTPTSGADRVYVGYEGGSANWMNGTISRIRIYNRALSDAQLQALTQ